MHSPGQVGSPRVLALLGPAFVAAVAYVDPGNVAAILGATVMPRAIYLHSALAVERYHKDGERVAPIALLLRSQCTDVLAALALAGTVTIARLLYAAKALAGLHGDTIEDAHRILGATLGPVAASFLGIGLLASGIGSAIVGTHAGSGIASDTFPAKVSPTVTRAVTIAPSVLLLLTGIPATAVLVASQVVLSFGIGFAVAPLVWLSSREDLMGSWRITGLLRVVAWVVVVVVVMLNLVLVATWLMS